ncbi:type IV secretion system protein [Bartonella saheliensis]|uniref:type IV secretion system protein n=1 Tax=Bartonella saheliensis TaxID=1457016 RepID=UPI0011A1D48F|nr:type IV secretion system protein [Bartonella saheliensis]
MKKISIIIGIIILLGMPNLAPANENTVVSHKSSSPDSLAKVTQQPASPPQSAPSAEYLQLIELLKKREIIGLLNKQLELSKTKFEQTSKIHGSIMGNGVKHVFPSEPRYLLEAPATLYPKAKIRYIAYSLYDVLDTAKNLYDDYVYPTYLGEGYDRLKGINEMHKEIDTRIRYRGIIARAVGLQALDNTEKRFEKIASLLDAKGKTQDLKEATKLQAELRYMLTMIRNESIKIQMIRNFFNSERDLINKQRSRIYVPGSSLRKTAMPSIRIQ